MQVLPAGLAALIAKKVLGIPFITITHGEELTIGKRKKVHNYLIRKILPASDKVVTVSNFSKSQVIKLGVDRGNIEIIYNAIDSRIEPLYSDRLKKIVQKHRLNDTKLILMVGRLIRRKGFDSAIKVLSDIRQDFENVKLLIVGKGVDKGYLQKLTEQKGLNGSVVFVEGLSDGEVRFLYSICDVFLLPNRRLENEDTEGFGVVFLEAALFAKPVIGGKDGGTSDAILNGITGLLVDGSDLFEIKSAVLKILADPEYAANLGHRGKERVLKEFDIEIQQTRFNKMLRKLFEEVH
jgi:phosphatidylinositol alpha-1,6-mannosyltransferase